MNRTIPTTILALLTIAILAAPQNLLDNAGFENDATHNYAIRLNDDGTHDIVWVDNIFSPAEWTTFFEYHTVCSWPWMNEQPEARLVTLAIDPGRVRTGTQAATLFSFWRCHSGGFLQQVSVQDGAYYAGRVYAHSWYARCSAYPHGGVLDDDCETVILWAHDYLRICIDPLGGVDPRAPSVVCSEDVEQYGVYGDQIVTPVVQARGDWMTLFVWSSTTHPLKHNDAYFDDAGLWRAWLSWLPVIDG